MTDQYWSVTVSLNGDQVVTIEPNMLAGREIGHDEETAIRKAAAHLLSFIGDGDPTFLSDELEIQRKALIQLIAERDHWFALVPRADVAQFPFRPK
jgi:hypothetical protein